MLSPTLHRTKSSCSCSCRLWSPLLLGPIQRIPLGPNGSHRCGEDYFCHRLGCLCLQEDTFWPQEHGSYVTTTRRPCIQTKDRWECWNICLDIVIKSKTSWDFPKDLKEMLSTMQQFGLKLNPTKCSFDFQSGKFLSYRISRKGLRSTQINLRTWWRWDLLRIIRRSRS